jgi:hypothetical protein
MPPLLNFKGALMIIINYAAAITSAILAFILGAIWYSPKVFGKTWQKEANISMNKEKHSKKVYIISFIFTLITALAFALCAGPAPTLGFGIKLGLFIGISFVACCFGINYLFSGRSTKLLLIDAGYHIAQFVLYGIVFALWP